MVMSTVAETSVPLQPLIVLISLRRTLELTLPVTSSGCACPVLLLRVMKFALSAAEGTLGTIVPRSAVPLPVLDTLRQAPLDLH